MRAVRGAGVRIRRFCGAPQATGGQAATRPGYARIVIAGVIGGLFFDATTLGLRHITGAPSFPEDVSDLIVPYIPADTFGRLLSDLGPHGKEIAFAGSLAGAGLAIVALAVLYGALVRRGWRPVRLAITVGVIAFVGLWVLFGPVLDANDAGGTLLRRRVIGAATLLVSVGIAVLAVASLVGLQFVSRRDAASDRSRRAFLAAAGGLAGGIVIGTGGLIAALRSFAGATNLDYEGNSTPAMAPITPNDIHYVVSKNLVDPSVNADVWRLEVTGLVGSPKTLTLDDLRALPQREEIVTLQCIASGVAGGLMSTARWRGPRLADIVALAGSIDPRARFAIVSAVDGYYDSLPVDAALAPSTLVALQMNGESLPVQHGFPARILVPGRYGEKNMKWLARIELADHDQPGFYQREGWSEDGVVRTWSRFDSVGTRATPLRAGSVSRIRGHAYAGARGIERVEISVDGGQSWSDADLDAALSPFAWRFFSKDWTPAQPGTYHLWVRATDGTGAVQEQAYEGYVPRGASGYHMLDVTVTA
jgi:DMSO/TMAO reductase YedYZ molybdopterin-dependent catalytic subunit